jgi:hypothetical protein
VYTHARADGQFWSCRSLKSMNLYLRYKYQTNLMKNKTVILQFNVPNCITYLHTCKCMHTQADYFDRADQLGTSISICYVNLNEFQQRIKCDMLVICFITSIFEE